MDIFTNVRCPGSFNNQYIHDTKLYRRICILQSNTTSTHTVMNVCLDLELTDPTEIYCDNIKTNIIYFIITFKDETKNFCVISILANDFEKITNFLVFTHLFIIHMIKAASRTLIGEEVHVHSCIHVLPDEFLFQLIKLKLMNLKRNPVEQNMNI